jgi:hypothetical protein
VDAFVVQGKLLREFTHGFFDAIDPDGLPDEFTWPKPFISQIRDLYAEVFIAAITQHIPDKGFQMVRYYGWYSNRARGERAKRETQTGAPDTAGVEVIDVSEYQPRAFPRRSGAS